MDEQHIKPMTPEQVAALDRAEQIDFDAPLPAPDFRVWVYVKGEQGYVYAGYLTDGGEMGAGDIRTFPNLKDALTAVLDLDKWHTPVVECRVEPVYNTVPLTKDDVGKLVGIEISDAELRYVNDNVRNHGPSAAKDAEYVLELINDVRAEEE